MTLVNTKRVACRKVRYSSPDELLRDVERLVQAEREGTLKRLGNWTLGQALGHLASWINFGYEGFPSGSKPPWIIRVLLRFIGKKYLKKGMPQGVRIPRVAGGTYATEAMSTEEGATRLRRACERMRMEPAKFHSPAFGAMSEADRVAMHLRHSELHMGFFEVG